MKIALIGYGKMGHIIEQVALSRGHKIVCVIDADNTQDFSSNAFKEADVAIEFSTPGTAVDNILASFAAGVPVVSGTTGWTAALPDLQDMCDKGRGTLLYASNFSIGVNIFMALNRYLAGIMNDFAQYSASMVETHHIHKLDHPSGTAITLAEELVAKVDRLSSWQEPAPGVTLDKKALPVDHVRQGEVPGIHTITWESEADTISITHSAKSREGFALGAVLAAEWLKGRKGFHSMGEMLSDITHTSGLFQ
ncbi:MAG: 4-hydroxy-tetrahydrodipicolinate reductase [Muribaculaceae bacterium]|nr:4-hydroxy-tetrahydrodipicolinate reductase [Muribaculaceae bacterium]